MPGNDGHQADSEPVRQYPEEKKELPGKTNSALDSGTETAGHIDIGQAHRKNQKHGKHHGP
jgi:hypothetical protein